MTVQLAWDLRFEDLYSNEGLRRIDQRFVAELDAREPALAEKFRSAREKVGAGKPLAPKDEAALLLEVAPHIDAFVGALFGVSEELADLRGRHHALEPLYKVKWKFVKRQAMLKFSAEDLAGFDGEAAERELAALMGAEAFEELRFAEAVLNWQQQGESAAGSIDLALRFSAWATLTDAGRARHGHGILFRQPGKVDPWALLTHAHSTTESSVTIHTIDPAHIRRRKGFQLTDEGTDLRGALDQANYCIGCHAQGKDSCSRGLREKPAADGSVVFKRTVFGVTMAGCPLEERISEFQILKTQGHSIGALAMITIDNPMAAATGHRICNDCMKACIYQKQTPVDIPQAETRSLKDVLELRWGFEIYSLLTRWNPLNLGRPVPRAATGHKVLVAGMGPAGFTLSHHLMNDGHTVVGIDGLKIEPLPPELAGVRHDGATPGERVAFEPIEHIETLWESLDDRLMAGFGGVAEYGITVRWNKNFLKVIRLLLERRAQFTLIGGVRFGGTLTLADAWKLGFDHVALAMGAGKPTVLDIPNGLARGVRTASDFLMALQLTGAAKDDSLANMQIRLPVVVIGGGLTAVDTATESLAYYTVQVEKFLSRHEALVALASESSVRSNWSAEEREVAEEFLLHGQAIRAEREAAAAQNRPARIIELIQQWGGVTLAYRKRMVDSPSYTLNHEEVEKALEEGIRFAECVDPRRIDVDARGAAQSITLARQIRAEDGRWSNAQGDNALVNWPARTIFVAAGTQPNTVTRRTFILTANISRRSTNTASRSSPSSHPANPPRRVFCSHALTMAAWCRSLAICIPAILAMSSKPWDQRVRATRWSHGYSASGRPPRRCRTTRLPPISMVFCVLASSGSFG